MVNFDTNNIVIVSYPGYAGGKFLINSLGLSNDSVFQDAKLAELQLDGKFAAIDKINYLTNAVSNISVAWDDLGLGDFQLFGMWNDIYLKNKCEEIKQDYRFSSAIKKISNTDLKFFIVAHEITTIPKYTAVWKNARLIIFKNLENEVTAKNVVEFLNKFSNSKFQKSIKYLCNQYNIDIPNGRLE